MNPIGFMSEAERAELSKDAPRSFMSRVRGHSDLVFIVLVVLLFGTSAFLFFTTGPAHVVCDVEATP